MYTNMATPYVEKIFAMCQTYCGIYNLYLQYPSLQLRHVFLLLFPGSFLIYTFDVPRIIYKHLNPQRMFRIVSNAERIEQQKLRKLLQSHIRPSADVNACPWPPIGLRKFCANKYSLQCRIIQFCFLCRGMQCR